MTLTELQRVLRAADPAAVLVSPRVLERVIQQVCNLTGLLWVVPHRKSYVVDRHVLFRHVEQDDLNLESDQLLPSTVILLARPTAEEFGSQQPGPILLKYWRRLFHANVHLHLEHRCAAGALTAAEIHARVEQIGQTEFAEVRSVLIQDYYLPANADERSVYIELAAVFLELRYFTPNLLPVYFPGIRDLDAVEQLLTRDLDAEALFERTRLHGAPLPIVRTPNNSDETHEYFRSLVRGAERAAKEGNTVKAAILRIRAARVAPAAFSAGTRAEAEADMKRLTGRLQAALQLSDAEADDLSRDLVKLLDKADQGRQPVEADLLYDLQKVCLDHERDIYALDLVEWLMSAGRRPIKRPLPGQRLVRVQHHLRSAVQRLTLARLADADRQHLSELLQGALHASEERVRSRFRPVLAAVLEDVGLAPRNPPERTAFHKMIEELLDRVQEHGFFSFGDLRDTISRNQLKLPDLNDPQEFIKGDPLLRLDARLKTLMDGVYRPSEIYIRWLERLTALNFGTASGRLLTLFVTVPFGAAFLIFEGVQMVVEKLFMHPDTTQAQALTSAVGLLGSPLGGGPFQAVPAFSAAKPAGSSLWSYVSIVLLGFFLMGLMHSPGLRRRCAEVGWGAYYYLRLAFVDVPLWLVRVPWLRRLLTSWPLQLLSWYAVKPLLVCAVLYLAVPAAFDSLIAAGSTFLAVNILLNTRAGQAAGESLMQGLVNLYYLLRAGLIPGMIHWVLLVFKRIIETGEYLLFTVDEWLRFRSGDSRLSLVVRTFLGVLWFPVSYVMRFYFVVLIEPCVNPIKLPISILAAKFVYPLLAVLGLFHVTTLSSPLVQELAPFMGAAPAWVLVIGTFYFLPDAVAFLIWEMKENWSLYQANRPPTVRPVAVGGHGETVRGLLQPGFHAGVVPKLYARLRLAERRAYETGNWRSARAYRNALDEVQQAVRRFVEREVLSLLNESAGWRGQGLQLGRVDLASNAISIELLHAANPGKALRLEFEALAGWLLAGVREKGWLPSLRPDQLATLMACLEYLYKLAGIDLVREQIRANLPVQAASYDLTVNHLVVWRAPSPGSAVLYDLRNPTGKLEPRTPEGLPALDWPVLQGRRLVFAEEPLYWKDWVESWEQEKQGFPRLLPSDDYLKLLGRCPPEGPGKNGELADGEQRPQTAV